MTRRASIRIAAAALALAAVGTVLAAFVGAP